MTPPSARPIGAAEEPTPGGPLRAANQRGRSDPAEPVRVVRQPSPPTNPPPRPPVTPPATRLFTLLYSFIIHYFLNDPPLFFLRGLRPRPRSPTGLTHPHAAYRFRRYYPHREARLSPSKLTHLDRLLYRIIGLGQHILFSATVTGIYYICNTGSVSSRF